ncbi:MAG: bifunctional (p)ppGpp synthetase/guanosine-3',5'-bis(diphosphate) 3'-pyrophosphohydrolase [Deltaproteobacteria bacterium]|nr:bifunctional (p)ppGpp synthetase/guanosine-3',5'-bis(diphosphate) 3'-pyrophosphohydrolase [Deltaproteobacteria bacterium]
MIRIDDVLDLVFKYNPQADLDLIKKAYVFSAKVHMGQIRLSGEPYLVHPLEVAAILAQLKLDTPTVITGLLHDTVEDTYTTLEEIEKNFGQEIAFLVDGVTKISRITMASSEEDQAENFRKMILAMVKDIRVILIKLADRLHNMRTLNFHSPEKQRQIAEETLDIYAPMAHRLGIESINSELEDLAFQYLHPDIYRDIQKRLAKKDRERQRYVEEVVRIITKKLYEYGLRAEVTGRPKRIYSIYKKMQTQNLDFEQVYDLIGFRIIVDSYKQCYEALGIIHSMWTPVPGKFKDYINLPKVNMYQSLHTTVIGHYGERIEIQIRTRDMHRVAEDGIAAHWKYKEGRVVQEEEEKQFRWLRQLLEWQKDLKDSRQFLETIKVDLYPNDVYVFTPKGEVKEFPRGATPVDFAYSIHTDVGHQCIGAKVNNRIVPLTYQLQSGDKVEILTSATHFPSKDWLKFVKTSRAKAKIRQWIMAEERERSVALGKALCEKDFRRHDLNLGKLLKSGEMTRVANEFSFHEAEDLMAAVGYGKISPNQIIGRLVPSKNLEKEKIREETRLARLLKRITKKPHDAIVVKGIEGVMVRFAGCCNPVPGDRVVGYITRGRGVTIHTADCGNVLNLDAERRIEVEWDLDKDYTHPVRIRILSSNRKGLLADISGSLSSNQVNIVNAHVTTTEQDRAVSTFQIEIRDLRHLQRVTRSLEKIKGVLQVKRLKV